MGLVPMFELLLNMIRCEITERAQMLKDYTRSETEGSANFIAKMVMTMTMTMTL
jgi:hypothetical protein